MDLKAATERYEVMAKGLLNQALASNTSAHAEVEPERAPKQASERALPLTQDVVDFKVGLFNTRTRLGHATQAVGTYALPGDTSKLRHPVRSAAARAATPGGAGGLGPRLRGRQYFRCPPGFEHGGRFAGRSMNNCGRRLFVPGEIRAAADIANGPDVPGNSRLARAAARFVTPNAKPGVAQRIENAGTDGNPLSIRRSAAIPEVGAPNSRAALTSIDSAVSNVRRSNDKKFLVRRDGFVMTPSVGLSELVRQKNNKDMQGGTLVVSAGSSMGKNELPVLINSSLGAVTFALPGNKSVTIKKNRNLTQGEKLAVNAAFRSNSGSLALAAALEASGGALSDSSRNASVKKVRVKPASGGPSRLVPEWVFQTFLQRGAPARTGRDVWVLAKD